MNFVLAFRSFLKIAYAVVNTVAFETEPLFLLLKAVMSVVHTGAQI